MKKAKSLWLQRSALMLALALSIPAFYLVLTGLNATYRYAGSVLYACAGMLTAFDIATHWKALRHARSLRMDMLLSIVIMAGMFASAWPTNIPWSSDEWVWRLGFCTIVFLRIAMVLSKWIIPRNLLQILAVSIGLLAVAGAGFYWLEPRVHTYADGLWLAFITGATVGYGDLVPSTPASRIFAVFIVLLGYAIFSMVTASIAALFVGEEEKRFEKELHADIKALREEIAALREQISLAAEHGYKRRNDVNEK